MAFDISKIRVPIGSLVVDAALVISIIYGAGQLTERLEQLSQRVSAMESQSIQPEADRRIALLEMSAHTSEQRLQRIEDKLDRVLERRQ